jgi:hypothetical protein
MRRALLLVCCVALLVTVAALGGSGFRASAVTGYPYASTRGDCGGGTPAAAPRTDEIVSVPKISGLPLEDAVRRLHTAGLRVATDGPIRLGPTKGLPPAWKQRPLPDTRVRSGSVVRIALGWALGGLTLPTFEEVLAPDVTGLTLREAIARLEGSEVVWHATVPRLRGLYADSVLDSFCVDEQTPAAGTRFVQTTARTHRGGIRYRWTTLKLHATLR